jgi:uroporphyrinogen-III decarboxylase
MSTSIRQDYIHAVFQRQTDIAMKNIEAINAACGDYIDMVFLCGTDFGTQNATFCSPDAFRSLWKPYYQRMTRWIHAHTPWKIFKHSCGAVEKLIPDFIDSGFDILNPVQCSAAGMSPEHLKQTYGSHITFWGAGIDTQHILPFGTPEEVRRQVLERCRIFGRGGGFVFNTIHNIQARTPIKNVVALLDALEVARGGNG